MKARTCPKLAILNVLLGVDLKSDESVCDAYNAIWHAELDMLRDFNVHRPEDGSRDFDNYDICDPRLVPSFVEKVRRLLAWCVLNRVLITLRLSTRHEEN